MTDGLNLVVAAVLRVIGRSITEAEVNGAMDQLLAEHGPRLRVNPTQAQVLRIAYEEIADLVLRGGARSLMDEVRDELHAMDQPNP